MTTLIQDDHVWQKYDVAQNFLKNIRGAIPLAKVQIECLLRLIQCSQNQVTTFLDLGCGDGILARAIADHYPAATGIALDFSEPMIESAKQAAENYPNLQFIQADFGQPDWLRNFSNAEKFDVIVSGFAIHHQPDSRKVELYREIYGLLCEGGIFLNLEHVSSASNLGKTAFDETFIDSLEHFHQQQNSALPRTAIANQYHHRVDQEVNSLASTETQCQWLAEIGFIDVDCYFKLFEIALFGGSKKINQFLT